MKLNNIFSFALIGLGIIATTSCSDDNGSNPTMHQPETFALNTPALAGMAIDLESSKDSLAITWSQPDYGGYPAAVSYYIQYTTEDEFNESKDDEGKVTYNYVQIDDPINVCRGYLAYEDINRNIMHLLDITKSEQVPATQKLNIRVSAKTYSSQLIYSNTVSVLVKPYFRTLVATDPIIWYMTGSTIGDGSWSDPIPNGCQPLYIDPNNTYDEVTGTGVITWTGYLMGTGMKFRGSNTDGWKVQIGQGSAFGDYVLNDGGSGNITVPADGYYVVNLDTKTNTPEITAYEGKVNVFTGIALSGSFNGWGDTPMTAVTTVCENHDWYAVIDLNAGDEVKFKEEGSWDHNWGGGMFNKVSYGHYGIGASNGWNFYIPETGTYEIFFNDITGLFRFVKQ